MLLVLVAIGYYAFVLVATGQLKIKGITSPDVAPPVMRGPQPIPRR
jgi:hypothetical protein